ncbi:pyrroloquinoline quinone biosynthesis peptide chaperone PqqD [Sulfitobacter sp. M57]|uniref:pyrroloquinoline quinone biosynthesis peptide chaperone PqqD n=1 Tax=unclassified Sulfitobacter TaxID=196795 RepID=UPI0023E31EFC|nr:MULTISPECIES: pyrroloquinoline quinone biosynthesis peptide chaperone PqqD [unclassified Sulfitobacter]MDF3416536.1 pyrroloquinoline quinone biosynthesis peptide chaperone PqqD [Sulfitobacter sp. KE5]MDF3424024.1 pyrroloquinoline quinone biosynthesis peptide chaperone PqqD [Sulfitobacter sp. KE43]MDF3435010.1 pyrroloquinoline quinone biosynthesis peptide chaperone PqqD [Sulfitobacter sp. KE42]MDF3460671.1 pyrroloquinoline quinone biosynthesis peptide chaperone PqqD [Sulfitobacter sp. S74]MD
MTVVASHTIPVIPRGVRLHADKVRSRWVLLAPERTIDLDPIGLAILQEVDGLRTFSQIVAGLAVKYEAPVDQISGDVGEFLAGLADRRIVELT